MKKLFLITLLLAFLLTAENSFSQPAFGVKGSFNFFNFSQKNDNGVKVENRMIPVFDAGIFAEFPIADEFVLRPELFYAGKGAKVKNSLETKVHLSYIELPVLFLYKGVLYNNKILLGIGPFIALGIGGKTIDPDEDIKYKNDISTSEAATGNYLKPLDTGAQMIAGVELKGGLSITINASLGLANIEPKVAGVKPESRTSNTGFGLSLGYRFGN